MLRNSMLSLTLAVPMLTAVPAALSNSAVKAPAPPSPLEAVQVTPEIFMIVGAGANITIDIGRDGIVVVDTGSAERADDVIALIKQLTKQPIRYIIDTSADAGNVGGNSKLSRAGQSILPAGYLRAELAGREFAPILAEQHVQDRMSAASGSQPAFPQDAWPTSTTAADIGETKRKLFLNGQGIEVTYQPAAHSDGDSMVYFRRSDVLVTGDLLDLTRFPVLETERGGSIQGILDALNRILDISISSVPFPYQEGGTLIIPGHGRLCMVADVVEYRDMITIIQDRIKAGIKKGMSLAQVQQADPTQGYRSRFGSDSGRWTTQMFVEAVYKDLTRKQVAKPGDTP